MFSRSGGNPLFAIELVHFALRQNVRGVTFTQVFARWVIPFPSLMLCCARFVTHAVALPQILTVRNGEFHLNIEEGQTLETLCSKSIADVVTSRLDHSSPGGRLLLKTASVVSLECGCCCGRLSVARKNNTCKHGCVYVCVRARV